jgi:hypothetical protein
MTYPVQIRGKMNAVMIEVSLLIGRQADAGVCPVQRQRSAQRCGIETRVSVQHQDPRHWQRMSALN